MSHSAKTLTRLAVIAALVLPVAACGTSQPASVDGLKLGVGTALPGTKGATLADQDNIDDQVAAYCATGLYNTAACKLHTRVSAERRKELQSKGRPVG